MSSRKFRLPKIHLSLSKFFQMKFNAFLFRFLPFSISRCYIMLLGKLYYLMNWTEKQLIRQTVSYICKRKFQRKLLNKKIKTAFKGIFDHYHEKLFVAYSNFPRLLDFLRSRVRFADEDLLQKALEQGKGVILVTGHFGAVEFLPGALALNGYPTSMICRFQTSRLRKSMGERAEAVGLNLIDADEGNIILSAMRALKQGRILITECDEFDEWRPDPHRDSRFLNCRLPSDRTLELLQKRSGSPVITALMQRQDDRRYTCNLAAIGNGTFPAPMPLHERCLSVLEATVENYPEQWYQWKKFGKLIKSRIEVENDNQEAGYLAPEIGLSIPDQA
ncbi:MAG: lysophospholipid acyltransferase family protein [Syntrophobacterales bacterium]|nr:lysophospholipid acyltransferase family protein [Syntrophobacterales bacterium]